MKISRASVRMLSRLGSCGAYGLAALELPQLDDRMVACTADLCYYSGLDRFSKQFPDRFYNVGIAEQNLVGIAAGLAKEGSNPFVSTYASFATTRALDQVRVNMGYMQLPIKLIGLTSGYSVGILGATHMSMEDIATIRAIPNIQIISPADCVETYKAVLALENYDYPVYLRLTGSMNAPIVYSDDYEFQIGKAIRLRSGNDAAILATGSMVANALEATKLLSEEGIEASVVDVHTIKPLDWETISSLMNVKLMVTIEEHSIIGGLGASVAEKLCMESHHPPLLRIGMDDCFQHAASYPYLITQSGLDSDSIFRKIKQKLQEV